jgi:uncharacterized protein (UPF0147 family)
VSCTANTTKAAATDTTHEAQQYHIIKTIHTMATITNNKRVPKGIRINTRKQNNRNQKDNAI